MNPLVDDIGSFPLPQSVNHTLFKKAHILAREAIKNGRNLREDEFLLNNFYKVVLTSFKKKLNSGLDVVNYPQHYDMYKQFADAIHQTMEKGTYIVDEEDAIIPEVYVIENEAKRLCEETGKRVSLRVCITGPFELYLRQVGNTFYKDVLLMFAQTARVFAKNSLLNSKYIKTEVVAIDEPSFGFQDIKIDRDTILDVLETTFDFEGVSKHIHLHSPSKAHYLLNVRNLDVLSMEYAASPRNIESISKKMLEEADKQIRIGISRTDVDSIIAELYDKGIREPDSTQIVESGDAIRKRLHIVQEKYGSVMTYIGPDCGLGGWPTQKAAQLLLRRTVAASKQ